MIRSLNDILKTPEREEDIEHVLRRIKRLGMGAGIAMSLSVLAVKCDANRMYYEIDQRLRAGEQSVEQLDRAAFYLADPCYTPAGERTYEVDPC